MELHDLALDDLLGHLVGVHRLLQVVHRQGHDVHGRPARAVLAMAVLLDLVKDPKPAPHAGLPPPKLVLLQASGPVASQARPSGLARVVERGRLSLLGVRHGTAEGEAGQVAELSFPTFVPRAVGEHAVHSARTRQAHCHHALLLLAGAQKDQQHNLQKVHGLVHKVSPTQVYMFYSTGIEKA